MQYSTLRVSALVAIFSASTALAYLDCGGGRAPPKTTVPGCPGYVGPTSVPSTSLSPAPPTSLSPVPSAASATSTGWDSDSDEFFNQFVDSTGVNDGLCKCSGYLCEFGRPGCVSINKDGVRSTITANPGYQSRTFDINAFSSYTASAGSEMYFSADGSMISLPAGPVATSKPSAIATGSASTSSHSHAETATSSGGATTTGDSSTITGAPTGQNTTMATITATRNSTAPGNTTAPPSNPAPNGASKASALSSLAVILGLGMGALAWL